MLVFLEFAGKDVDMSTAFSWSFPGNHVINLGRLVVIIWNVVIRVILVVKCEIYSRD